MRFKYGNKKTKVNGETFDSKKELKDWRQLQMLEKSGEICCLERQKEFVLIPTIRTNVETLRKTVYRADFFYYDTRSERWTIQDSKGFPTPEYKLKKKLMLWLYPNYVFVESGNKYKVYDEVSCGKKD